MAEAFVNLTEGSGKKAHFWDRTIGANTVLDEFTLPGEFPYASYYVTGNSATTTADAHIVQIMAGSSLNVRIRKIRLEQSSNASTAGILTVQIWRLTTAGTGGTTVTARPLDSADSAAGATAMTLPTSKGTESVELIRTVLVFRQAVSATATQIDDAWEWVQQPNAKPLIIPSGTSNGIAVKNTTGTAGSGMTFNIEFVETSFV